MDKSLSIAAFKFVHAKIRPLDKDKRCNVLMKFKRLLTNVSKGLIKTVNALLTQHK